MPTGYTAPIEDEDGYTFAAYLWSCMRAFDLACRDSHGPVPDKHEPWTSYEVKRLAELEAELSRLRAMTASERKAWADAENARAIEAHDEYKRREAIHRTRYEKMRARVEAWVPPTALHEGLRNFMLQQIDVSMPSTEADLDRYGPKIEGAEATHTARIKRCAEQIDRCRTDIAATVRRAAEMDAWVAAVAKVTPRPEVSP